MNDVDTAPEAPGRWRRIVAAILAVIGAVLILHASIGWWAKRYFLDTDRFTANANEILAQEPVQDALAVAITEQISKASGRDLRIAEPFITTIVREIVTSDAFQTVFDAAVSRSHHAVVEGGARDVILNLSKTVDQVKNALEPIAPDLADEIPDGETVSLRVLEKTELQTIYDVTNLVEDLVVILTILAVAFLAAGVALSPRRWRTLALAGWVTLGAFSVSLIAVLVGRVVVGGLFANDDYSSAAESAYKVITHGLVVQAIAFGVLGLLVALASGWIDRNGGWLAARAAGRGAVSWARAQVPEKAAPAQVPEKAAPAPAPVAPPVPAPVAPPVPAPVAAPVAPPVAAGIGLAAGARGILAARLPEPPANKRTAHWWRAIGLLALGVLAVISPGSLTTIVVVMLGVFVLYLALTEALAAWSSPKEPRTPDERSGGA